MVTVLRVSQLDKFKPVYQVKGKPDIKCKPRLQIRLETEYRPVWVSKSGSSPTMGLPSSFLVM